MSVLSREHPLVVLGGLVIRLIRHVDNYWRLARLRRGGLRCDGTSWIHPEARILAPSNVELGKNCYIGNAFLYGLDHISIGDKTIISDSVFLCTGSHDIGAPDFRLVTKPICIGSCVWIATGATVLPGVTIGDGAVVGAMSVVSRNVESGSVVAGNPARVVKAGRIPPVDFDPLSLGTIDWRSSLCKLRTRLR